MDLSLVENLDCGPRRVGRRAVVHARPEELFALLANPHRHHEVDGGGTVKAECIGPRELRLGDKFRINMKAMGVPYAITNTVVALEPDRVVEWQHPGKHTWRWEFEPHGDDETLVTEIFDYTASPVPWLLERLDAPARNGAAMTATLHRLQQAHP